eukprot:gnl/TRDRNA2_/TRDRNA2_183474_c0_seq1.p1 gnl/TRDRNA2_/TRDRNA2_183474_c0~~gnl/TRDRNA2_/TRDRNA2_183474_c0_seq1.p1  ORF type:complete len:658 (-),score=88.78 gnl/TRDRNA2_/TRDRNA2_183474_c0_seq1:139-2040(-)
MADPRPLHAGDATVSAATAAKGRDGSKPVPEQDAAEGNRLSGGTTSGPEDATDLLTRPQSSSWEFPLTRKDKWDRLLETYQEEVDSLQWVVQKLKAEKDILQAKNAELRAENALLRKPPLPDSSQLTADATDALEDELRRRSKSTDRVSDHSNARRIASRPPTPPPRQCVVPPLRDLATIGGQASSSSTVGTPTSAKESPPAKARGSVLGVRWGGGQKVNWVRFDIRGAEDAACADAGSVSGQLLLRDDEHVQVVRGYVDGRGGHVADWLVLITSKLRQITFGWPELSNSPSEPTFSFFASQGHEICGIVLNDSDGSITDVHQCSLGQGEAVPATAPAVVRKGPAADGRYSCSPRASSVMESARHYSSPLVLPASDLTGAAPASTTAVHVSSSPRPSSVLLLPEGTARCSGSSRSSPLVASSTDLISAAAAASTAAAHVSSSPRPSAVLYSSGSHSSPPAASVNSRTAAVGAASAPPTLSSRHPSSAMLLPPEEAAWCSVGSSSSTPAAPVKDPTAAVATAAPPLFTSPHPSSARLLPEEAARRSSSSCSSTPAVPTGRPRVLSSPSNGFIGTSSDRRSSQSESATPAGPPTGAASGVAKLRSRFQAASASPGPQRAGMSSASPGSFAPLPRR